MEAPVKGSIVSMENGRLILLTTVPELKVNFEGNRYYQASGLVGHNRKTYEVTVRWKLTPAFETALDVFPYADERNETTCAIIGDTDGAAEWDKPIVFRTEVRR